VFKTISQLRVQEGWAPIFKFLGVPEPDIPFPNINDTNQLKAGLRRLKIKSLVVVVALPAVAAIAAYVYRGVLSQAIKMIKDTII
jgi:hypothetical protein